MVLLATFVVVVVRGNPKVRGLVSTLIKTPNITAFSTLSIKVLPLLSQYFFLSSLVYTSLFSAFHYCGQESNCAHYEFPAFDCVLAARLKVIYICSGKRNTKCCFQTGQLKSWLWCSLIQAF